MTREQQKKLKWLDGEILFGSAVIHDLLKERAAIDLESTKRLIDELRNALTHMETL